MRPTCPSCRRPMSVCLCDELPPQPLQTATKIIILQHPHETKHKLATVPIITRCLANCDVIVGRRLQPGTSNLLDAFVPPACVSPPFSFSSSPSPSPAPANDGFVSSSSPVPAFDKFVSSPSPPPANNGFVFFPSPAPASDGFVSSSSPVPAFDEFVSLPSPPPANNGFVCSSSPLPAVDDAEVDSSDSEKWPSISNPFSVANHSCKQFVKEMGRISHSPSADEGYVLPPGETSKWLSHCESCGQRKVVLLLFPSQLAGNLTTWVAANANRHHFVQREMKVTASKGEEDSRDNSGRDQTTDNVTGGNFGGDELMGCCGVSSSHVVLLVMDGTWQHAREMVKASMPFLGSFVEQVCLPHDVTESGCGMGDSSSIIRKEPFAGCVSTMEAVAQALKILEPHGGGVEVERILLSVLRRMVALQTTNFTPLKPRLRLQKGRPLKIQPK